MQNAKQTLVAVRHHLIERQGKFSTDVFWCFSLDPGQQLHPQRLKIGINGLGRRAERVWKGDSG